MTDAPSSAAGLHMWLLIAAAACATTAAPEEGAAAMACSCPGQPELCRPLDKPLPARDVHVYSDCTSPPGAADPEGCDWHKTLNFSAVTTVVRGRRPRMPGKVRTTRTQPPLNTSSRPCTGARPASPTPRSPVACHAVSSWLGQFFDQYRVGSRYGCGMDWTYLW